MVIESAKDKEKGKYTVIGGWNKQNMCGVKIAIHEIGNQTGGII